MTVALGKRETAGWGTSFVCVYIYMYVCICERHKERDQFSQRQNEVGELDRTLFVPPIESGFLIFAGGHMECVCVCGGGDDGRGGTPADPKEMTRENKIETELRGNQPRRLHGKSWRRGKLKMEKLPGLSCGSFDGVSAV